MEITHDWETEQEKTKANSEEEHHELEITTEETYPCESRRPFPASAFSVTDEEHHAYSAKLEAQRSETG